ARAVVLGVVLEIVGIALRRHVSLLLSSVDGLLHDAGPPATAPDVDRQLLTRLGERCRNVSHADPLVEHGRMSAGRDLAALEDRHALAWHRALLHHERNEPARRPGRLDPAQLLGADEV